uniref:Sodium/hydrogen exchanger n=1 Tax=Heterorhabditis bacteriophora TaxID=37862 RepID=A0A1I7XGH5_HETBA
MTQPNLFFLYLLPPIALDAGYFLPNNAFFSNIGTILLYAVFGTVLNIILIAGLIYVFSPFYEWSIPFIDILLYSTLISAVDPVAVLSVFEEIHVNQLVYICVFGESLLNDAVTILENSVIIPDLLYQVLYHSLSSMAKIGAENLICEDFYHSAINFVMVSTGGILIGLVWVCITAFATKIVTCGLMMKPYIAGNLNDKALTTVKYFLKTLSSCCEAIIFVFLGLSTFSKNHSWDIVFTVITVSSCILCRFIDKEAIPAKDMLVSTTVVVIVVTVFFQGTTIKPLVKLLNVKTEVPMPKTVTQQVVNHVGIFIIYYIRHGHLHQHLNYIDHYF